MPFMTHCLLLYPLHSLHSEPVIHLRKQNYYDNDFITAGPWKRNVEKKKQNSFPIPYCETVNSKKTMKSFRVK